MFCGATGRTVAALGAALAAACFMRAEARAEGGKVIVKTSPPGANVYIDSEDEPRGVTPLEIAELSGGLHKVRVSLAGHADQRRGFYLALDGERQFSFTLSPTSDDDPEVEPWRREPASRPEPAPKDEQPAVREEVEKKEDTEEKAPKTIDVNCPFCKGSKVMDKMGCITCRGSGYVDGSQCEKCSGSRRAEFPCPYCKGEGNLVRGGKEHECPKCRGKGNLPCPYCRGAGTIKRANPEAAKYPTTDCRYCNASGYVPEVKCTFCGGSGSRWVVRMGRGGGGGWGGAGASREELTCRCCGGEGKGPPLCRRCQGRAFQGKGPCLGCYGTGLAFIPCPVCRGRAFVKSKE